MTSKLASIFVSLFSFLGTTILGKYLTVFLISMIPLLELRGGLIAASCLLHLPAVPSLIVSIVGNMLPVPFILMFIMPLFDKLKKTKMMKKVVLWCEKKADKKKGKIEKLQYYGLFLFVAIPLPSTGAWMGSLIASILHMDKKKSFLSILFGVITAGIIMLIISYVVLGGICQ